MPNPNPRPFLERDENSEIDEQAGRIFKAALPAGWVDNPMHSDYAKDHHIEITAPVTWHGKLTKKITGKTIYVQRKGTKACELRHNNTVVAYELELRHLIYWADESPLPVFLIIVDLSTKAIYWLFLQRYLTDSSDWRHQSTFTLHLPVENNLATDFSRFESEIDDAILYYRSKLTQGDRLRRYLTCIKNAHGQVSLLGLPTMDDMPEIPIRDLFVQPAFLRFPENPDTSGSIYHQTYSLAQILESNLHLLILGDPGTGKSTVIDWLAYHLASDAENSLRAKLGCLVPIPLVVRDLNIDLNTTWDSIFQDFLANAAHHLLEHDQAATFLNNGTAFVLIDAIDEITDEGANKALKAALRDGIERHPRCRWLITSRIAGYADFQGAPLTPEISDAERDAQVPNQDQIARWYLAPFNDNQIAEFLHKWYKVRSRDEARAAVSAEDFLKVVRKDPGTLRLARTPNLLALMAIVHRSRACLPDGKALLYEDVARAYLESIDQYRKLGPEAESLRTKKRWLARVAFEMQSQRSAYGRASDPIGASETDLVGWIEGSQQELGKIAGKAVEFIRRIHRRSGLIVDRIPGRYCFVHLSFQEYFAAYFIKEKVVTPSWLRGKGVAKGMSAVDLRQRASEMAWEETLVFLFELVADDAPEWDEVIREALFGTDWECVGPGNSIMLAARLADNAHVRWNKEDRGSAHSRCFKMLLKTVTTYSHHGSRPLSSLLRGEADAVHEKLAWLCRAAIESSITALNIRDTDVTDLSSVAGVRELKALTIINTGVRDLSPLRSLSKLEELWCSGSPVRDLAPLSGMVALKYLHLSDTAVTYLDAVASIPNLVKLRIGGTLVVDLRPLKMLAHLETLEINGTGVTDLSPLYDIASLRILCISEGSFSNEQLTELRLRMPKCHLSRLGPRQSSRPKQ